MTATQSRQMGSMVRKLSSEGRPPPVQRRDERIKSVASSFEEITESEEEENQMEASVSTSSIGRSPYAVQTESPFSQRRSNSLTVNPLISPKFNKRPVPSRLLRGFSDPVIRRKGSLPCLLHRLSPDNSSEHLCCDLLSLPPIPEAATPASPSSLAPTSLFKESNNNDPNTEDKDSLSE